MLTIQPADVARDIMARLKNETALAHARVDAAVAPMLKDRLRYRELLLGLRGAQLCIERELERHVPMLATHGYDVRERTKVQWLDDDLATLGVAQPERGSCALPFSLRDPAAAFGAVYVTEGATLGGQVIVRIVAETLSLTPTSGCRYFDGHGSETRDRWRRARASIGAFVASERSTVVEASVIAGAQKTFALVESAVRARECR